MQDNKLKTGTGTEKARQNLINRTKAKKHDKKLKTGTGTEKARQKPDKQDESQEA